MSELQAVLRAFYDATRCEVAVWIEHAGSIRSEAAAPEGIAMPDRAYLDAATTGRIHENGPTGPRITAGIPGPRRTWITVGPVDQGPRPKTQDAGGGKGAAGTVDAYLAFLLPMVGHVTQASLEVEHAANELAERYEEINLLYTISEILGRTVTLEEAAATILTEVCDTVGARKGAILVHDRITDTLVAAAALGAPAMDVPPIATSDPVSVSARAFRTQHPLLVEAGEQMCEAEAVYRAGAMLTVPIMWTTPDGGQPLGVVNLSDRRSGQMFSAGDQKLLAAIATQIATTIQNTRLVRASLTQQQMLQEMQLAHDLQMRLLPQTSVVGSSATVAARLVPAESVGGDFYNLFPLPEGRVGVMIGDVSGHGYQAALVMALAMSASAFHAPATTDPAEFLTALGWSLRDELATSEMFISGFYCVVDRNAGELRYANTGHPHAFVLSDAGVKRLEALDPPLGMSDTRPQVRAQPWAPGRDLLVLFTDGISDARNRWDERLGEGAVLDVIVRHRKERPEAIVDRVFEALARHTGDSPRRDDLTLVVMTS